MHKKDVEKNFNIFQARAGGSCEGGEGEEEGPGWLNPCNSIRVPLNNPSLFDSLFNELLNTKFYIMTRVGFFDFSSYFCRSASSRFFLSHPSAPICNLSLYRASYYTWV